MSSSTASAVTKRWSCIRAESRVVQTIEELGGTAHFGGEASHVGADAGHVEGRGDALARDVADDAQHPPVAEVDEVVEVAADGIGRHVLGEHAHARRVFAGELG